MTQVLRGYLPLNATPVDAATGPGLERNMMTTLPVLDINIYCTSYFSLVARSYVAPKNDAVNCAIAITVYIGCDIRSCELLIEYLHSAIFPSNQYGSVTCGDWAPRSGSRRMGAGLVETIH